jgi:APA family basic amino acid/polyamine antiporter
MVNLAEETKNPEKTMPIAIIFAAIFASLLYVIISFVTVNSFDKNTLENIKSPLTAIIANQGHSPLLFDIIAMISITNGILVNIIMASRLIFGMTKLKTSPKLFSNIYEKTQIPLFATVFVMIMIVILAYWFPIQTLAKITSTIMLVVFCLMHLSLIVIKTRTPEKTKNHIILPLVIPVIGFVLCSIFLIISIYSEL